MSKESFSSFLLKNFGISEEEIFKIAKRSILHFLKSKEFPKIKDDSKKAATFVTLFKNNNLRGCIGSIFPHRPIKLDVAYNAINAAFFDPRFEPLKEDELKNLEIEISILTPLKKFEGSLKDWINFLKEKKPGVFIKKEGYSATFLPDVWKELKDPFEFMNHLSLKAGLGVTDWIEAEKYYYFTYSSKRKWKDLEI